MAVIVSDSSAIISFISSIMLICLDNIGGFVIAVEFIGIAMDAGFGWSLSTKDSIQE